MEVKVTGSSIEVQKFYTDVSEDVFGVIYNNNTICFQIIQIFSYLPLSMKDSNLKFPNDDILGNLFNCMYDTVMIEVLGNARNNNYKYWIECGWKSWKINNKKRIDETKNNIITLLNDSLIYKESNDIVFNIKYEKFIDILYTKIEDGDDKSYKGHYKYYPTFYIFPIIEFIKNEKTYKLYISQLGLEIFLENLLKWFHEKY